MHSTELVVIFTWLLARDEAATVAVHGVDRLGAVLGRPERLLFPVEGGWSVHAVDPLGQPQPRPGARLLRLDGGGWGLFAVDVLGRSHAAPDLLWHAGARGFELREADLRGRGEARPTRLLVREADRSAVFPVYPTGEAGAHPDHVVQWDAARGGWALHGVGPQGETLVRPSHIVVARARG